MFKSFVPCEAGFHKGSISKAKQMSAQTKPVDLARMSSWTPSILSYSFFWSLSVHKSLLIMKILDGVLFRSQAGGGRRAKNTFSKFPIHPPLRSVREGCAPAGLLAPLRVHSQTTAPSAGPPAHTLCGWEGLRG